MTEKPERNEPCWCGSGKKYKKCHYLIEAMPTSIEEAPYWIQMRVAEGELQEEMGRFFKAGWEADLHLRAQRAFFGPASRNPTTAESRSLGCPNSQTYNMRSSIDA